LNLGVDFHVLLVVLGLMKVEYVEVVELSIISIERLLNHLEKNKILWMI
jgi:hypothetical protein